ncbi:MAG: PAS domain S-box-containing protein [Flavobacteriaceae bacterium]|jgi:PAS domain S-box-containing protein
MQGDFNLFRFFGGNKEEFKPYYQKENSFRRLVVIHSIAAFVIAPIYCLFIYQTEIPEVYIYLGVSYTVLFPLYMLACWSVRFLQDKLIYFFIVHLFGMTLLAYTSLLESEFEIHEFFCFYALYAVTIVVMQRWYPAILYNVFVLVLMVYGFKTIDADKISTEMFFGLFFVLALSSSVVLYSRQRMINAVEDYSHYLKKIMNNPGSGYLLIDRKKDKFNVIDFNDEASRELNVKYQDQERIQARFFSFLKEGEREEILNLKLGDKYVKTIRYHKFKEKHFIELDIIILSLKNGYYWLVRINDVTETIAKREQLEQNEKKYRNLYYRNKAGVFTIDKSSKIINGNEPFFRMLEDTLKVDDLLFSSNQQQEWSFIIDSLGKNESLQNYQTQFLLSNSAQKIFIFSWYLDNQTGFIEGSVIDLTTTQKAAQALKQSEEKYRSIYAESNDAILLLDGDRIIEVNRKAIQLFGIPEKQLLGMPLFELSTDKSKENHRTYKKHHQKLQNLRSTKFEWLFNGNAAVVEGEVSLVEIILEDKLFYQCVIHDRTDLNKNVREIEGNRRNLENILDNNPEGILIVRDNQILYKNTEIEYILGKKFFLTKLFTLEGQGRFDELCRLQIESGARQNIQLELLGKTGENLPVDVTMVSTTYEEVEATLIIIKDISVQNTLAKEKLRAELAEESNIELADEIMERIKAEKTVKEQFLRTKAILDSSSNTFLLTLTLDQKISTYNTHFESYFFEIFEVKIKVGESFDSFFKTVFKASRLRYFRILFSQIKLGKSHQFEVKVERNNVEVWLEIFVNPIFDTEGAVAEISLVAHDISEKRKSNMEIIESLKEKEVLLKEIHHRVKNNLQVISSILNLQSSFVTDENTLGILQESRSRIRSMAIIHENLYRTEDFSSINFADYLQNLTANLIATYRIHDKVFLDSDLDPIDLILDQAIPCGLLVNELITNSLKYAWAPGQQGTITLRLKEEKGVVSLFIGDDGVGLPAKFEEINSDTLGLQLVVTLIEQLDGELDVNSEKGTKYLIKFDNIKSA